MYYYALSDIHGEMKPLQEAMKNIDLTKDSQNKMIFLGDYIDNGIESYQVLYYIKDLVDKYGDSAVIVLRGNHEEMFLDWLFGSDESFWLCGDIGLKTTKSFLSQEQTMNLIKIASSENSSSHVDELAKKYIKHNHKELLSWLRKLPYYYETDKQIFVHAGIDEESEDMWKYSTSNEYFVGKFPPEKGHFYKDIIAGHISTSILDESKDYHEVYWDGESHYYTDGDVNKTNTIPVLKYNEDTGKYSSFRKIEQNNHNYIWEEFVIN